MMVRPAVVCGSETQAMVEMDMKRLGTWERKIVTRLHRPAVEQGIWRIRTGQELRELCRDLDIVAGIKKKKIRMDWTCSRNG